MLQIEVAGTVIQLADDEAALVVYCNETWRGISIVLKVWVTNELYRTMPSMQEYLHQLVEVGKVRVIGRSVGEEIKYAAVFPRIDLKGEKRIDNCQFVVGRNEKNTIEHNGPFKITDVTLFAGNVTEIDWTMHKHYRLEPWDSEH